MKRPAISVPILRPIFGVLRAYWRSDRVMLLLVAGAVLGSSLVAIAGPYHACGGRAAGRGCARACGPRERPQTGWGA